MLASPEPTQYTHMVDKCKELAVEKAPILRRLNVKLCFVEPLEDLLLHVHRRPFLWIDAMHHEIHNHGPVVEMAGNPVVTTYGLDGVAEELFLAVVPRGSTKVGSLKSTCEVYQRTTSQNKNRIPFRWK